MWPKKGSMWNVVMAFAWFFIVLAASTVFISTIGHYGWHWAPFWIAIDAAGTVYYITRLEL